MNEFPKHKTINYTSNSVQRGTKGTELKQIKTATWSSIIEKGMKGFCYDTKRVFITTLRRR